MMKELTCPHCESLKVQKVADSPVKGKWESYRCAECNFVWRSTEDLKGYPKNIAYLRERVMKIYPWPEG